MKTRAEVEEFREQLDAIRQKISQGKMRGFRGTTHEESMDEAIRWVLGELDGGEEPGDEHPLVEYREE